MLRSGALKQRRDKTKSRQRQNAPLPDRTGPPIPAVRVWLFRIASIVLTPLLVLGLLEGILRVAGYGYDTGYFKRVRIQDKDFLVNNDDYVLRFFPPEMARLPRPVMIEAEKPPDVFRVFIFGESAAEGDPDPAYGPARFMEVLLRERFPRQKFEIVNVAITANNSHGILPIARECAGRQGDVWIVYMGNNEMVGPFGTATVFGAHSSLPLAVIRTKLAVLKTRTGQWLSSMARRFKERGQSTSQWGGLEMFVKNRVRPDDPRKETVYQNFAGNLRDMLKAGVNSNTKIILNTMSVNLRDCPPLASMPSEGLAADDRSKCDRLFADACSTQGRADFGGAAKSFERAAALDPHWAELQYRWGQCLLALTNYTAARQHFQAACDADALPARSDSRINAIIRQSAKEFFSVATNLVLLESPTVVAAGTTDGICGDESFYEHVHFKCGGSYRLGRAWAEQVESFLPTAIRNPLPGPWASQSLCERRLALTDWNRRNDLSEITGRRHAAPLSSQSNNAQQLAALQTELAGLNKRMDANDAEEARKICLEAIEHAPQDMDLHGNFADFLEAIGDPKQAVEQWRQVQQIVPQYYMGYFQEGRMLERLGQLEQARAAFERTIALRPAMAPAWFELSNIDASQGKLERALGEIDCARQRQPHQPAYYACMGKLLSRMNRHADALERYRQALRVDTNYWDGRIALGEELAAAGNLAEAQGEFEAAIKLRPDSARAHLELGAAFARQGRLDDAQHEFETTLQVDPGNKAATESLNQIRASRAGRQ
jgi:tetratricopeptide (TPR) repeat protein